MVTDESPTDLEHFYQLGVYCCENLLFCFDAAIEVAFDCSADQKRSEILELLELEKMESDRAKSLFELFVIYAVAYAFKSKEKTAGMSVLELCSLTEDEHQLDTAKVQAKRETLRETLIAQHGDKAVTQMEELIRQRASEAGFGYRHLVSGKTYLLPLLLRHLKWRAGYKGELVALRNSLARHCSLDLDSDFAVTVRREASGKSRP